MSYSCTSLLWRSKSNTELRLRLFDKLSNKKDDEPTFAEFQQCRWRKSEYKNQLKIDEKKTDR